MDKKLNLSEKLDFNDIDLTAPEIVIQEILEQLPEETNGIIIGEIATYDGPVMSYTKHGMSGITAVLGTADREVDIQTVLGKIGKETHKFECFLHTPEYNTYKYRVFFMKYDIANYPATIILEDSVARSISSANKGYIFKCNTRAELEDLVINILSSKRIIEVMQELIRINQAKKTVMNVGPSDDVEESE